jgi:hypothetical protein
VRCREAGTSKQAHKDQYAQQQTVRCLPTQRIADSLERGSALQGFNDGCQISLSDSLRVTQTCRQQE